MVYERKRGSQHQSDRLASPLANPILTTNQKPKTAKLRLCYKYGNQHIQKLAANSTTYAKIVSLAFGCKNIHLGSWQSVHS
jgi:hypothetical protein